MNKKNTTKNSYKNFGKMVSEFGSNWKKIKDTAKKNLNTCSLGSLYSQLLDEGYSCSDLEKLFGVPRNKIPKAIANYRNLIKEDESKNQDFEIVSSWIRANSMYKFRRRDLGFLYNEFKKKGYQVREAAYLAGLTRFRPVILTAITTILGLVPMVFGLTIRFSEREIKKIIKGF